MRQIGSSTVLLSSHDVSMHRWPERARLVATARPRVRTRRQSNLARVACRSWRNEAVVLDKVYGFKPTCRQCSVVDEMPSPPCGAYEFKVESSLPATGMALTSQLPAQLCHVQIARCCTAYIQCSSCQPTRRQVCALATLGTGQLAVGVQNDANCICNRLLQGSLEGDHMGTTSA